MTSTFTPRGCDNGVNISAVSAEADAVITTTGEHDFSVGDKVTISGVSGSGRIETMNGEWTVAATSTSTTFTVGFDSTGMTHAADAGKVIRLRFTPPSSSVARTNKSPGASDRQTVTIEYPPYDENPVWQAALKDADVTLPTGMGLAPGGGEGLQVCTFAQFGVNPATGKQETDDPARCPEGSHVGDVEVVSPALPTTTNANGDPVSIAGKAFFGPTGSARPAHGGQPVEAVPPTGGARPAHQARREREPVGVRAGADRSSRTSRRYRSGTSG